MRGNNRSFLLKNYLAHTKNKATMKSLSQKKKKKSYQIKLFILSKETFVFFYYEKLKKITMSM